MTKVITAVEPLDLDGKHSVFLAGAIDMGSAVDWQSYVIKQMSGLEGLIIVNPRRPNFTPDTLDEQIRWELEALELVDEIFMWFPKDAKAPISFLETGLYLSSGKMRIGVEVGFYRRRNLELTCEANDQLFYNSLNHMVEELFNYCVNDLFLPDTK